MLAQGDYPAKAITIVVPFSAGGGVDGMARLLAEKLRARLKQTVLDDNKPGASGNIGMELAGRAAPDGYTIAMGSFGPLAVNPWIHPRLNFDPKAFVPIILLEKNPLVLVAPMVRPFANVNAVVAAAKAKPGVLNIANAGPGGAQHLSAELFEAAAGIDMAGVPFIGTVGAVSVVKAVYIDRRELKCACVGGDGQVPLGFVSLTENLLMVAMGLWMWMRYGLFGMH